MCGSELRVFSSREVRPLGPSQHRAPGTRHAPGRGLQIALSEELFLVAEQFQLLHQVLHHHEHVVGRAGPALHHRLPCAFPASPRHPILQARRRDHCCRRSHRSSDPQSPAWARARISAASAASTAQPTQPPPLPGDRRAAGHHGNHTPPPSRPDGPSKFWPTRAGFLTDVTLSPPPGWEVDPPNRRGDPSPASLATLSLAP